MTAKREKANGLHPVSFIATQLGIDRKTLTRRLKESGFDSDQGISFRDAFGVLSGKFEEESSRRRKQKAEAENAEIDNAEKRGDIRKRFESIAKDLAVTVRTTVESASYIPLESRQRLSKELARVKVEIK